MGQVQDRNEFIDDAGFVSWLINDFIAQNGADAGRVFLGGHSNGAFFAHYLAGLNPGRFAGLTSIMGRYYKLTVPRAIPPIPTLIINGLQDPILPIEGKVGTAPQQNVPAAQDNIEYWASIMGLEASASRSELKEGGYRLQYKDAFGKVMLVADYVDKQGHWIPGARPSAFQSFFAGPINMSYKGFDKVFEMLLGAAGTGFGD
jgi:poly(3-hydroxybutyrate) depolymerase